MEKGCRILVEIAQVPFAVRCRHMRNVEFFSDYRTDRAPCFEIDPTEADLERIRASLTRMDAADGACGAPVTDQRVENNVIHELLSEKLVGYDVLLMHGSALCMDGAAYVFTAKSGTGKSTHAALWRQAFGDRVWMINDDKPMLRIREGGAEVFGTPWNGKHSLGRNASAPLKAVCKLERAKDNRIERLPKQGAFPLLLAQCYTSKDPAVMARIMELEKHLLNAVDFYTLGCNQLPEAAMAAWRGMNAQ